MKIVWDEPKRLANLEKHGLDFADLEAGFDFDAALTVPARPSRHGGRRFKAMGPLGAVTVAVIFAPLGAIAVSIISLRRANLAERKSYDQA